LLLVFGSAMSDETALALLERLPPLPPGRMASCTMGQFEAGVHTGNDGMLHDTVRLFAPDEASVHVTVGAAPTGQAVLDFGAGDWIRINNVDFGSSTPTRILKAIPKPRIQWFVSRE